MSSLIWVVVPNGHAADANALQAHIVIMPRLTATSLAEAGMAAWPPPELAAGTVWIDVVGADGTVVPPIKATVSLSAEPGLWARYFPPDTPIAPSDPAGGEQPAFVVQPLAGDAAAAERIFREAANAPLGDEGERRATYAAAVAAAIARHPVGPPPPRPGPRRVTCSVAREGAPEFHDTLGLLREHPTVGKALGLIFAVQIPLPATALPTTGTVKARWDDAPARIPTIMSPRTGYELSDVRFQPQSTDAIVAGMVPIGDAAVGDAVAGERVAADAPGWRVLTIDACSAVGAIRDAAAPSSARTGANDAPATPLPALRSGGISIARVGLQADIDARHAGLRARAVADADTVLTADDLLLGYRLDVQRDGELWRSLTLRNATYFVDTVALAAGKVPEEGHIKAAAALDHGDGKLVTDDIVARWTGWSVAIQRPSYMADQADAGPPPGRLTWRFEAVPGSLPALRFGGRYRLRLRAADIAGGGLAVDDPLAERATTEIIAYGRYEPIASPQLLAPVEGSYLPGESDSTIVLRSDRHLMPKQFVAANPAYAGPVARLLTPPLSSLEMAERHQTLDRMAADEVWQKVSPVLTRADPASRLALADPAAGGVAGFVAGMATSVPLAWPSWPSPPPKRIVVQTLSDPLQPRISWQGDDLIVLLAPAATTTVELSSTLRQGLEGQMAAEIVAKDGGAAGIATARDGRNPLMTPSIAVTVTHATRLPVNDPSGALRAADRVQGETGATLTPTVPLFGVDPESTAVLEISADWLEPDDATSLTVTGRMVKAMTIDRGAVALPEPIRHDFRDTRHRSIRYTAKAISRFRHCFLASEPDEWFAATLTTDPIEILNSGTPAAVKVLRAFPSFVWTIDSPAAPATIIHRRETLVRVEIERPWFQTGAGEALAVIVAPGGVPSPAIGDHVSEVGRDPIWQTGVPPRWIAADALSLASGPAVTLTPPGLAEAVTAVPHAVAFDAARGCWFCDIALDGIADASYAPLVRLALARYQAASIDGQWISRVVRTDFVPLLPARTLTVDRSVPSAISATLAGVGPDGDPTNAVEYVLESAAAGVPADAASMLGPDSLPLWRPDDAQTIMAPLGTSAGIALPPTADQLRLRVAEMEPLSGIAAVQSPDRLDRRVIYSDLVPLR